MTKNLAIVKSIIKNNGDCGNIQCDECPLYKNHACYNQTAILALAHEWLKKNIAIVEDIASSMGWCAGVLCSKCPLYNGSACETDTESLGRATNWLKEAGVEKPEEKSKEEEIIDYIIEHKGACTGISCMDCPFYPDGIDCHVDTLALAKSYKHSKNFKEGEVVLGKAQGEGSWEYYFYYGWVSGKFIGVSVEDRIVTVLEEVKKDKKVQYVYREDSSSPFSVSHVMYTKEAEQWLKEKEPTEYIVLEINS